MQRTLLNLIRRFLPILGLVIGALALVSGEADDSPGLHKGVKTPILVSVAETQGSGLVEVLIESKSLSVS